MIYLSQRNPAWAQMRLGTLGLLTIGGEGCTTTCLAMINNEFGANCTPDQVAAHFGWYTPEGLVNWPKLDLMYAKFEPMGRVYSYDKARVKDSILHPATKQVALEVHLAHGRHWLKATRIDWLGRIWAADPWTGRECDVVKSYGPITGSAHFTKK